MRVFEIESGGLSARMETDTLTGDFVVLQTTQQIIRFPTVGNQPGRWFIIGDFIGDIPDITPPSGNWLLSGGVWSDAGEWDDTEQWSDAA